MIAELGARPQVGEVVGSIGHALSACCDYDVGVSGYDGLGAEDEGFDGGCAHFVDSGGYGGFREAGAKDDLTSGILSETEALC